MWSANRPFSQSETELLRAQLNEVGPKELCCRPGARPLNTTHVWPRSTAAQPDGIGRESILRREENRSTRRKTLGVRLRSTETQPTYDPRPELNLGHRGGRHGWWPLNHPDSMNSVNKNRRKTAVYARAFSGFELILNDFFSNKSQMTPIFSATQRLRWIEWVFRR